MITRNDTRILKMSRPERTKSNAVTRTSFNSWHTESKLSSQNSSPPKYCRNDFTGDAPERNSLRSKSSSRTLKKVMSYAASIQSRMPRKYSTTTLPGFSYAQ